jgi:SAM-dependent methyltransferase
MSFAKLQEDAYDELRNYRYGSPHLTHRKLGDQLTALMKVGLQKTADRGLPATVLEIGAGDGTFTEPVLAAGFRVTATEVSQASVDRLKARFGRNANFEAIYDPEGSLEGLESRRFSSVLCVSLLHHIPDYLKFIGDVVTNHLQPGGSFISIQDPAWHPSLNPVTRRASRFAFLSWRITQGNLRTGFQTQLRRFRGVYDDTNPSDVVEYHAVRRGVDQDAIAGLLSSQFTDCKVILYWSSQAAVWQRAGEFLGMKNTFAVDAQSYLGAGGRPDDSTGADPSRP